MKVPLTLQSGQKIFTREGLFLYYPIDQHYIVADVAPLPGFSDESLFDIRNEIKSNLPVSPSLQCGLEALNLIKSAMKNRLSLFAQINRRLNLPFPEKNNGIRYNGLVAVNDHKIEDKIQELCQLGIKTIKIKVGFDSFDKEYPILNHIILKYLHKLTFRLDPNQQWTSKIVETFFSLLPREGIEYIEDPVSTIDELRDCVPYFDKIALDYFCKKLTISDPIFQKINFIVYKPTLMGGLTKLAVIKKYFPHVNIIISHSFESSVGIYYLNCIAAAVNHHYAHGLLYNF